jgi:hypothetical protein
MDRWFALPDAQRRAALPARPARRGIARAVFTT